MLATYNAKEGFECFKKINNDLFFLILCSIFLHR